MNTPVRLPSWICAGLIAWAAASSLWAQQPQAQPHGIIYYLDGAGGGGVLLNWGRSIKRGLRDGGFRGEFEDYDWQTGLGPLLDHAMSEPAKRETAGKLAQEIQEYMASHPGTPVHLIGLSAGTAVLVYALEQLSPDRQVDNVILLSSSMDAGYDLSRALRHVRGKAYVFTSRFDPVLNSVVPMMGTADRGFATRGIAGVQGFMPLDDADAEAKQLYRKLVNVPWRQEFTLYGNFGSHTGATSSSFVERYISPLVKPAVSAQKQLNQRPGWSWPRAAR